MSVLTVPADRTFRALALRLVDVEAPEQVVEEVVFADCRLRGPGCQFRDCVIGQVLGQGVESILWPWPAAVAVAGCLGLRACLFERCTFEGVGFTGVPAILDELRSWAGP